MLVGVAREVEVERRNALLDESPGRLTRIGDELHQLESRQSPLVVLAEVRAQERPLVVLGESVVDREVREVEVAVVAARVLPVDDPQPAAVVEQVAC